MHLLGASEPVETVLARADTPEALRERLELVAEVRRYAAGLGLDVGNLYTSYAEWPGDFVVMSVMATRPGEVEPVTSWFPIVGSVPYRGYFDAERAEAQATRLRERGLDVCTVKVPAYSTLGWFDDPLTGPMVRQQEPLLVETVFHELLHATVFVAGEADFNEGVAAFVGQEARVRFYAARDPSGVQGERERRRVTQVRRLRAEILALRRAVATLYATTPDSTTRSARRAALEAETRSRIGALELDDRDSRELSEMLRLNDACLALSGTYHADTPRLEAVLDALDGDLAAFVAAVKRAAGAEDPRAALLGGDDPS